VLQSVSIFLHQRVLKATLSSHLLGGVLLRPHDFIRCCLTNRDFCILARSLLLNSSGTNFHVPHPASTLKANARFGNYYVWRDEMPSKLIAEEAWLMLFRKPVNSNGEWHFRPDCPWWPQLNYYESVTLRDDDHICKKCIRLQIPAEF